MSRGNFKLIVLCFLFSLPFALHAQLKDQGLNSILQIIDKAIDNAAEVEELKEGETEEDVAARRETATATIVNLSRTLGTLSYSRLQCGEADVLAEFTQRVQLVAEENRDAMRDAFQEGFDKSKAETELLSKDECRRLTASRNRQETAEVANVAEDSAQQKSAKKAEAAKPEPEENPKLKFIRVAELSGQLAYKREFCDGKKVFTRDYNEYIAKTPEEFREDVKNAYWKGYKHGKRLNRNLTRSQCS